MHQHWCVHFSLRAQIERGDLNSSDGVGHLLFSQVEMLFFGYFVGLASLEHSGLSKKSINSEVFLRHAGYFIFSQLS